jgi:hypothetical protein
MSGYDAPAEEIGDNNISENILDTTKPTIITDNGAKGAEDVTKIEIIEGIVPNQVTFPDAIIVSGGGSLPITIVVGDAVVKKVS